MKIFGSDGFRSEFGTKYMTEEFLSSFAESFSYFCHEQSESVSVVIGRDTRKSGKAIEKIFSKIFSDKGIDVTILGTISTPGLSYITKNNGFSYGIMITASHNPASDNGIKIFSKTGFKLDSESEKEIENKINKGNLSIKSFSKKKITSGYNLVNDYVLHIKKDYLFDSLKRKYLIDCSNGSNSKICKELFSDIDNIILIYDEPNGHNINLNCGALEPERLYNNTLEKGCDFGVAFDGDGDRIIFCHKDYGFIDTEKIISLFSKNSIGNGRIQKTVVSTQISNMGLRENLSEIGFELIETELGDRIVVNKTIETNSVLGAETSGHFFFPNENTTMDGLLAFFKFINVTENSDFSLVDYLKGLKHYKRITKNIPNKNNIDIALVLKNLEHKILENEKIVIRESMWDPVIRVYYDYDKVNRFDILEEIINGQ